ncbi:scarecrow-like protein 21 [Olea europaea var. sylvestris]|uniref:scarecrow-like protein 21 n=1 Tax=Olea europaea var. sylvestris TaxID=158386 RepID=UPI000C1CF832|nr:scarecrow-like protein 21 [Olea europaea var. sylvestris]
MKQFMLRHRMKQPFSGCSGTGEDLSNSSYPIISSVPTRLFDSLKFETGYSPNSPFTTHFESQTLATFSDSREGQNSTDTHSEATPSSHSSLVHNKIFQQLSHSPNGLLICSGGPFLQNANHNQHVECTLEELETALMGPDDNVDVRTLDPSLGENNQLQSSGKRSPPWNSRLHDQGTSYISCFRSSADELHAEKRLKAMEDLSLQGIPQHNLKQLLVECARALFENKLDEFEKLVEEAQGVVSISGEPIQRLGAYMVEGLVARKESSGSIIYRALKCREPESKDLLSYMHILYEVCPYFKLGYMAANGAIAEACRNEDHIHIIDFQIAQGTQWITLLQALAARPSGAPRVRITGIDDPVSNYAHGDGLAEVGRRLAAISDKFNIPVEFHAIPVFAAEVTMDMLDVRPGEALAVNFPLQLHHTPDESVDVSNPRDGLLRMVKSLSPKVITLIEQESNTNTAPFFPRFLETLEFYAAMFESIDVTMPRHQKERINVEQHCLARDIVNIIACEGKERVERHELFGKWKSRFTMAGFRQYPLSPYINSVIRDLLGRYSEHYTLLEKDEAMLLGWKERKLISASAWH